MQVSCFMASGRALIYLKAISKFGPVSKDVWRFYCCVRAGVGDTLAIPITRLHLKAITQFTCTRRTVQERRDEREESCTEQEPPTSTMQGM